MAGKAPPCITMMLCVAGCSTTSTGTLPHSRTSFPPPNFDVNGAASPSTNSITSNPTQAVLGAPAVPSPLQKPVTIDVPMPVVERKAPRGPVLSTRFEDVPESHLTGGLKVARKPAKKPFFTALAQNTEPSSAPETPVIDANAFLNLSTTDEPPALNEGPAVDANAMLGLLTAERPPNAVILPEPISYPQYVEVGPEYFGADSDIAPYILDPTGQSPQRDQQYARLDPAALRPQRPAADAAIETGENFPTPQRRPSRPLPEQPAPEVQTVAIVPPRPEPSPKRVPSDPIPRTPARTAGERISSSSQRGDPVEDGGLNKVTPREKTKSKPKRAIAEAPESPQYLVRLDPAQPTDNVVASLNAEPAILTEPLPDLSVVRTSDPAEDRNWSPTPKRKPPQRASVRFANRNTDIPAAVPKAIATQPANDSGARVGCHVNRGSNDRMILICKGIDVSQAHVFRAVVEGESAFRGLRAFDESDDIVSNYGFNAERFNAMSQGPRSARDIAFLRALRESRKTVRMKGRAFDMYLMKGDNSLATVLVEQAASVEPLKAVGP